MTPRIHGPHTTCPSCREEVYLDELVGGRCPLCGYSLEEGDGEGAEFEEFVERSDLTWLIYQFFLFRKLDAFGVNPARIMQIVTRYEDAVSGGEADESLSGFAIPIPMKTRDRIRPKRCAACRKIFLRGGTKTVSGDLRAPAFAVSYFCPACAGDIRKF
jgi:hypothetical protein